MGSASVLDMRAVACHRGGKDGLTIGIERLHVAAGEAVAITGPSGCGKSTLLDLVGLVLRPSKAQTFALCGNSDIPNLWAAKAQSRLSALRAHAIGYVLQTGGLLPFLSVRENIRLSCSVLGQQPDLNTEDHVIGALGLRPALRKKPSALSLGERQRVAIARALSHRPPLVLADEPTASLDPAHSEVVMGLFLQVVKDLGLGLLMVNHDWDLLDRFPIRQVMVRQTTRKTPQGETIPMSLIADGTP